MNRIRNLFKDRNVLLIDGIIEGNIPSIQKALSKRADINRLVPNHNEVTPLMLAIEYGRLEVVHFLLIAGASLDSNLDINSVNDSEFYLDDPLVTAIKSRHRNSLEMMESILNIGASTDKLYREERTVLDFAIETGDINKVNLLLTRGVLVDQNSLYRASYNYKLFCNLLEKGSAFELYKYGETILDIFISPIENRTSPTIDTYLRLDRSINKILELNIYRNPNIIFKAIYRTLNILENLQTHNEVLKKFNIYNISTTKNDSELLAKECFFKTILKKFTSLLTQQELDKILFQVATQKDCPTKQIEALLEVGANPSVKYNLYDEHTHKNLSRSVLEIMESKQIQFNENQMTSPFSSVVAEGLFAQRNANTAQNSDNEEPDVKIGAVP